MDNILVLSVHLYCI